MVSVRKSSVKSVQSENALCMIPFMPTREEMAHDALQKHSTEAMTYKPNDSFYNMH